MQQLQEVLRKIVSVLLVLANVRKGSFRANLHSFVGGGVGIVQQG